MALLGNYKSCAKQLCSIFHHIFNESLQTQHVPKCWRDAVLVPVPKINGPKILNDFRSVALTSIVMKTFEKLARSEIIRKTETDLDPLQFAYRTLCGVEDATVILTNLLFKRLEGKGTHARLLFVDFSPAFNTMHPHILIERLLEHFNLSINLVGWILDQIEQRE